MSDRKDNDCLKDILEAVGRIKIYTEGMVYSQFQEDVKTQDAVIRNMEIIGEATKNLSKELKMQQNDLPWKGMAGIRDRLIHHYFGINLDIVWSIISIELAALEKKIEIILTGKNY